MHTYCNQSSCILTCIQWTTDDRQYLVRFYAHSVRTHIHTRLRTAIQTIILVESIWCVCVYKRERQRIGKIQYTKRYVSKCDSFDCIPFSSVQFGSILFDSILLSSVQFYSIQIVLWSNYKCKYQILDPNWNWSVVWMVWISLCLAVCFGSLLFLILCCVSNLHSDK